MLCFRLSVLAFLLASPAYTHTNTDSHTRARARALTYSHKHRINSRSSRRLSVGFVPCALLFSLFSLVSYASSSFRMHLNVDYYLSFRLYSFSLILHNAHIYSILFADTSELHNRIQLCTSASVRSRSRFYRRNRRKKRYVRLLGSRRSWGHIARKSIATELWPTCPHPRSRVHIAQRESDKRCQ